MRRSSTKQQACDGVQPVWLPKETLLRLEALRERNGKASVVVVIEEAVELYARRQDSREMQAFGQLTPRLREVLLLIADGLSTKEIAAYLNISKKTVEFHRSRLMKKLGIRSVALLARYAVRVGAIPP
jgi:RNA polymerase sigma factor (sigma-70 family)